MYFDQSDFDVRCEWGERGVAALAPISDVIILIDVLSFCTCVAVAVGRGAAIYPYGYGEKGAADFARDREALLATPGRDGPGYSLSPASLLGLPAGSRLVLPSPNGAALTLAARQAAPAAVILAGCLRNARAVAAAAGRLGRRIAVIPAGERWPADRSLRPAIEDWIGAGAIIAGLPGTRSAEAEMAAVAFAAARADLPGRLAQAGSGRELLGRGFAADVALAADLDADEVAPRLIDGEYYTGV